MASLQVRSVRFHNFRNYRDLALEDMGNMTIFVGPNAVGKTNIVEGVQLLTALESFRNPTTDQLIAWGCERAALQAKLADGNRELEVRLVLDERGRHFMLNGKQRPRQELQGLLPAVVFSPDDLQVVKGGSERRRVAIDALGVQVSRNYLSVKRDYEKLLRQKNRLLKDEVAPGYLASVNEVLARIGSQLYVYRMRIVRALRAELPKRHALATGSDDAVALEYRPAIALNGAFGKDGYLDDAALEAYIDDRGKVEAAYIDELERRQADEMVRRMCLVGPQRDKVVFHLNGKSAADFASQGQQRSLAIAFKLSELNVIENMTHQRPLLLLDDVMSELDARRREMLTRYVRDAVQTIITTANLDYFTDELRDEAAIISLPMGEARKTSA